MKHTEEKKFFNEKSISDLWDKFKQPCKHVVGIPKGDGMGEMEKKYLKK